MAKFTFKIDSNTNSLYIIFYDTKVYFNMDYVYNPMIELLEQGNLKEFINKYEQLVNRDISYLKRHIENRKKFVELIEKDK